MECFTHFELLMYLMAFVAGAIVVAIGRAL